MTFKHFRRPCLELFRSQSLTPLLLLAGLPLVAGAQVSLLPPEMLMKLVPASERPLALAPDGEALRFRTGTEQWEEGMPPAIVDVDQDGMKDYIILILVDGESGRRALLARVWGDKPDAFGPTVFYAIIADNDDVTEWAGSPRLDMPGRSRP